MIYKLNESIAKGKLIKLICNAIPRSWDSSGTICTNNWNNNQDLEFNVKLNFSKPHYQTQQSANHKYLQQENTHILYRKTIPFALYNEDMLYN